MRQHQALGSTSCTCRNSALTFDYIQDGSLMLTHQNPDLSSCGTCIHGLIFTAHDPITPNHLEEFHCISTSDRQLEGHIPILFIARKKALLAEPISSMFFPDSRTSESFHKPLWVISVIRTTFL